MKGSVSKISKWESSADKESTSVKMCEIITFVSYPLQFILVTEQSAENQNRFASTFIVSSPQKKKTKFPNTT